MNLQSSSHKPASATFGTTLALLPVTPDRALAQTGSPPDWLKHTNAVNNAIDSPALDFSCHQSGDLDETRQLVAGIFCDHRLHQQSGHEHLSYHHQHWKTEHLSFSLMSYGAAVHIEPGSLERFFLVQIPLAGSDQQQAGSDYLLSHAGYATVHSPEDPLAMNWSSDCRKIVVRIEREALERHTVSLLGRRPRQPLGFQVGMDLSSAAGRAWSNMAHCVFDELRRAPQLFEAPLIRTQFEQTLMTTLLQWQPNNLQGEGPEHKNKVLPRYVKLAEEYLQTHPEQPITAETLATLTGVSARSLYSGFQSFLGMSPMRYLRDIRMERVRQDLLDPHKPRSVTAIATHWGFFQLGRFATEYRNRFAEAPRETILKRH